MGDGTMTAVTLTAEERDTIDEFVTKMRQAGKGTKQDDFHEAYASGKGCEQAVARFLNDKHDIDCSPDYDVYRGSDTTDLEPYQAEVKSVVGHGSRLSIPTYEAEDIGEDEPIIAVRWHNLTDYEILGWCYKEDLTFVEQGAKPWTQLYDNLVAHESELSTDWYGLCVAMGASPTARFTFTE